MNMNFHLFTPTRLIFGAGKLNELGNQTMPGRKALLLISNGKSARRNGSLDRTLKQLRKAGAEAVICGNVHENPFKRGYRGVAGLKMGDYGIKPGEFMTLAVSARETMGGLFLANPCEMSDEECAGIFEKSYRE